MNSETENKIVSLRRAGSSIRGIARQLGIPRYQVAKVLRRMSGGVPKGTPRRFPLPRRSGRVAWTSISPRWRAWSSAIRTSPPCGRGKN